MEKLLWDNRIDLKEAFENWKEAFTVLNNRQLNSKIEAFSGADYV